MPIYEYQCKRCGDITEDFFHSRPPLKRRCNRDGCEGFAERIMSVFQGPEQMRNMAALKGGQKFTKRRREWREKTDEGRTEAPPV
jgi:putative FmdB family regulatory protein